MQSFKSKCKIAYFKITMLPVRMARGTLNNSEFVNHWRIIVFIIIHDLLNVLLSYFILFEKTNTPCNIGESYRCGIGNPYRAASIHHYQRVVHVRTCCVVYTLHLWQLTNAIISTTESVHCRVF